MFEVQRVRRWTSLTFGALQMADEPKIVKVNFKSKRTKQPLSKTPGQPLIRSKTLGVVVVVAILVVGTALHLYLTGS